MRLVTRNTSNKVGCLLVAAGLCVTLGLPRAAAAQEISAEKPADILRDAVHRINATAADASSGQHRRHRPRCRRRRRRRRGGDGQERGDGASRQPEIRRRRRVQRSGSHAGDVSDHGEAAGVPGSRRQLHPVGVRSGCGRPSSLRPPARTTARSSRRRPTRRIRARSRAASSSSRRKLATLKANAKSFQTLFAPQAAGQPAAPAAPAVDNADAVRLRRLHAGSTAGRATRRSRSIRRSSRRKCDSTRTTCRVSTTPSTTRWAARPRASGRARSRWSRPASAATSTWTTCAAAILFMQGLFATTTPRNDASSAVGQWDVRGAYRVRVGSVRRVPLQRAARPQRRRRHLRVVHRPVQLLQLRQLDLPAVVRVIEHAMVLQRPPHPVVPDEQAEDRAVVHQRMAVL